MIHETWGGRMSSAPVSPAKQKDLERRMAILGVREEDLEESFIRASGPGGQKVNKTSSCVVLKHKPTGLVIKCMESRSRELNRFLARRRLVDRIAEQEETALSERRQRIEKIRRQKRKRSKRAKEKVLADKKALAQKKELRKSPGLGGNTG
jgi:protein subunit release factor B